MPGTRAGGLKTAQTIRERYGEDHYQRIGRKGGNTPKSSPSGFAADHDLAIRAGRLGGLKSRRTGVKNGEGKKWAK